MKTINLTVLFLLLPLIFFAQSLTGLWTGTLTNDSNTIRRDQSFEIVLTQYKDKVYGYSRMTFFVHDTLYYIVKRVKGTVEGEICEVKDDDVISHNFPRKPDKGVKLVSTFRRNKQDSIWYLDGDWKTTETKRHGYYSISGKISLKPETDLEKSKIIPHLEELKLADDVAFYKDSKKAPEPIAITKPQIKDNKKEQVAKTETLPPVATKETKTADVVQKKQPAGDIKKEQPVIKEESKVAAVNSNKKDSLNIVQVKSEPIAQTKPQITTAKREQLAIEEKNKVAVVNNNKKDSLNRVQTKSEPITQTKQPISNVKKEQPVIEEKTIVTAAKNNKKDSLVIVQAKIKPVAEINQPVNDNKKQPVIKEEKIQEKPLPKKPEPVVVTKPVEQKKEPAMIAANTEIKKPETIPLAIIAKEKEKEQPVTTIAENKAGISTAAALVAQRSVAPPQIVTFKSDSLELALYDNGEVDGDTVSVLLNGEIILAKQGLKVSAIRKTIYVPAGTNDSMTLVLYAENLGKYPPNTGLLVVHDGDDVYQIRFTADLQQNAAIIFKRKRN